MKFWKHSDGETDPEARRVRAGGLALAVALHAGLGVLVMSYAPERPYQDDTPVLSVDLVTLPPEPVIAPEPEPIPEPVIEPQPEPEIQPEPAIQPEPVPNIPPEPEPEPEPAPELFTPSAPPPTGAEPQPVPSILQNEALSEPGGLSAPANPSASDQTNAADDARIDEAMAGLGRDLKCLRSTDPDCRTTRNYLLEEYRLTETQKVWTSNRSDTGMPSAYYGLSEREIMKKLNVAVAGENDMVIPFTNLGIMGSWADALHGAKGKCDFIVGGNSKSTSPEEEIGGFNYGATGRAFARNCDVSNERPSSTGPAWGN